MRRYVKKGRYVHGFDVIFHARVMKFSSAFSAMIRANKFKYVWYGKEDNDFIIQLLKDKLVDKDTYSIHDHTRYMCSAYLPREFRPNKFPSRYKLEPIRDAFNLYLLKEYHGSKYRQGVDEHEILCS